jgi:hypothetical protein
MGIPELVVNFQGSRNVCFLVLCCMLQDLAKCHRLFSFCWVRVG